MREHIDWPLFVAWFSFLAAVSVAVGAAIWMELAPCQKETAMPESLPEPLEIVEVYGDDWEGWYFDGVLRVEAHRVGPVTVLQRLQRQFEDDGAARMLDFRSVQADEDWLEERGSLPDALDDVVTEP
jgi:hypothetical protein